jgi:hypothetical protein
MKKTLQTFLVLSLLVGVPWTGSAQRPEALDKLMVKKLDSSKALLEGIALGNFKKISSSADQLVELSRQDAWFVFKTPRYENYSNDFRRAAETIAQKANEKNLDGVTLAYIDLTMSCVRCHKYVREVRDARVPGNPHGAIAAAK